MKMIWIALPSILSALTATGLGLFVWRRNVSSLTHRLFAGGMTALAVMETGNGSALLSSTGAAFLFWKQVAFVGEILLPLTWLAFTITFTQRDSKAILSRWRIPLIAFISVSVVFLSMVGSNTFIYLAPVINPSPAAMNLGPVGYWFYIYLLLSSVFILSRLESIFRSSTPSERWQIKFLIIGIGTIFAFAVYSGSQTILYSAILIPLIPIQSMLNLAALGLIAFGLVRHRNLDVDVFISRHVVYGSAIVVIVGLYLLGVGLLTKILGLFENQINPFLAPFIVLLSVIGLVILLSSDRVTRRIRLFISEHFYKHKYDFHLKWLEAVEKLGSERTVQALIPTVSEFLKETLGAKDISVWLYEKDRQEFARGNMAFASSPGLVSGLKEHPLPMALNDFRHISQINDKARWPDIVQGDVLVPLIAGGQLIGFMSIGPDITGKPYVQNDYDLLTAVGKQAAYQLLNARMMADLSKARELEAFHEMSTFVIHDLKNLTNTLSLLVKNVESHFDNPAFRSEALRSLTLILSKLNAFVSRLSGLSKTLRLNAQPADLNELILESLTTLDGMITAELQKTLPPLPRLIIDRELIKSVVINVLMNAQEAVMAAAKKGTIRIATRHDDRWITLTIGDDGRGMSPAFLDQQLFKPFRTTKSLGLGIGLFQTKKIVEAHGGTIDVQSQEGVGTTFDIRLPSRFGG